MTSSEPMSDPLRTAILLIVFNRPHTTRTVFDAIRQARPSRLYVAADGPRNAEEAQRCEEVRAIATQVDWECDLRTLFREKNLGMKMAESGAMSWFFEEEEEGIVLEDDTLPDPSFFGFSEELLSRYRDEPRIMMISGNRFVKRDRTYSFSYSFSHYPHTWGWAGWRRAWDHYDRDMAEWPALRSTGWLRAVGGGHRDFEAYWRDKFDAAYDGTVNTWDYQWVFSCWVRGGLSVAPSRNLVSNIGFGEGATHAKGKGDVLGNVPLERMPFPMEHPAAITRDRAADRWTDLNIYRTRQWMVRRTLKRMLNVKRILGLRPDV